MGTEIYTIISAVAGFAVLFATLIFKIARSNEMERDKIYQRISDADKRIREEFTSVALCEEKKFRIDEKLDELKVIVWKIDKKVDRIIVNGKV